MTTIENPASRNQRSAVKTILIVENDEGVREFFEEAIKQETRHRVLAVSSGQRAIEIVQHVKPDVFLFDYYLNEMTGIDLYKRLHARDELAHVPTIIFSASLSRHLQEIDDHHLIGMSKPVDLDDLLQTIAKQLEGKATNEPTSQEKR